jgi:hypothetical protein
MGDRAAGDERTGVPDGVRFRGVRLLLEREAWGTGNFGQGVQRFPHRVGARVVSWFHHSGVHSVVPARHGPRIDSRVVLFCRHVGYVHLFEVEEAHNATTRARLDAAVAS